MLSSQRTCEIEKRLPLGIAPSLITASISTLRLQQTMITSWHEIFSSASYTLPETLRENFEESKTQGFDWWALQDSNLRPAD